MHFDFSSMKVTSISILVLAIKRKVDKKGRREREERGREGDPNQCANCKETKDLMKAFFISKSAHSTRSSRNKSPNE